MLFFVYCALSPQKVPKKCIAMICILVSLHTIMPKSVFKLNLLSNSPRNRPKWVCIEISRSFWDFLISFHYYSIVAKNHFQLNSLVNPRGMLIWLKMGFYRHFPHFPKIDFQSPKIFYVPTRKFFFQSPKIFYVPTRKFFFWTYGYRCIYCTSGQNEYDKNAM